MDVRNAVYNCLIRAVGLPYKGPPTVPVIKPN